MQTIFNRSFIALLAALALGLAGCSGGDISRGRAAATSSAGSAGTVAQTTAAPAIVGTPPTPQQAATAVALAATERPPCTNGVVPPSTPSLIWCDDSTPGCWPTPNFRPAKCPCATGAEIDAALISNEPWTCPSAGGGQ